MEGFDFDSDSDSSSDFDECMEDLHQLAALDKDVVAAECSSIAPTAITQPITATNTTLQETSRIESALALNKILDEKYKKLEKILTQRLLECRAKLQKNADVAPVLLKSDPFSYKNCGRPYFKDQIHYSPPDNEDTILMKKSGMYDFSTMAAIISWTIRDKNELLNAVHEMSQNIRQREIQDKILELQSKEKTPASKKQIAELQQQIKALKKKSLAELALPIEENYDWESVADSMNGRHLPQEYNALWKLFFHPSINKSQWSKSEHQELHKIAKEHNMQDWDAIAKKLNTGRTGYQCFVYSRTNMSGPFSGRKWTKEEVEYLKRIIDYYKEGNYIPWGRVASAMENRTKIQIYNKYMRMAEQRKGRFLREEDSVILSYVNKYGLDFKDMSQYLPGRSAVQLRVRYQILSKMTLSATWSVEDDRKLLQIMANQDSMTDYSTASQFFPGKDRMNIRSRYTTLMKWMKSHPDCDIAFAPRRGMRRLYHGQEQLTLKKAIENLKQRIQNEVNKTKNKKIKKLNKKSPENEIEDAIMTFLYHETTMEQANLDADNNFLDNGEQSASKEHNIMELRHLLILLNSALDKEKFLASNSPCKDLAVKQDTDSVKVKSYSRKNTVTTISLSGTPNVWGENRLCWTKYMLPPHLANITGCRVLMKYISSNLIDQNSSEINLSTMARRNHHINEAMFYLRQRFSTLFLWPILLSNITKNPRAPKFDQENLHSDVFDLKDDDFDATEDNISVKDDEQ